MSDYKKLATDLVAETKSAGKKLGEGVDSMREKIAVLKRERIALNTLPVTLDEATAKVDAWIERMVSDARALAPSAGDFARPNYTVRAQSTNHDALLMRAYLGSHFGEAIKKDLQTFYQDKPGVSPMERTEKIRDIEIKILHAEFAEESMIRAAEEANFTIIRRADADPRAVLAHDKVLP